MTASANINSIDLLIGKTVLSRSSGNKAGQVYDLVVDPLKGALLGLAVKLPDESVRLIEMEGIYSFGHDAVMIKSDESAVPLEHSSIKRAPLARQHLNGAKVITEDGRLLGHLANIFIQFAEPPLIVYEVRSSLLDKLLKQALFFPASWGGAISDDAKRVIVPNSTPEKAFHTLDDLAASLFEDKNPMVVVRSHTR